jgi:hypothetical protein
MSDPFHLVIYSLLVVGIATPCAARPRFDQGFRGSVTDSQVAVIADATVTAKNLDTNAERTTQTDPAGHYSIRGLPPGRYVLNCAAAGFKSQDSDEKNLESDITLTVNFTLEAGSVTSQVEVTSAEAQLIDVTSTAVHALLSARQIENLPLNGRDVLSLLSLQPGVTQFLTNGIATRANTIMGGSLTVADGINMDGGDNNSAGITENPSLSLPLGALREVSIVSQSQAEFGRYSSGSINLITKAGSNQFHGTAMYAHRNSALAARDFFEVAKSRFLSHQFAPNFGGPIARNRTFFFVAYEGMRELDARPRLASVPSQSALEKAGSILAANGVVENRLSSELLNLFPKPDKPGDFHNRTINAPAINNANTYAIRLDHSLSDRDMVFARYNYHRADQLFPPLTSNFARPSESPFPGFRIDSAGTDQAILLNYTKLLSSSAFNEARLTYHRTMADRFPEDRNLDPISIGLNTGVTDPEQFGLPFIAVTGFDALGSPVVLPLHQSNDTWQLADSFILTRGRHQSKFGGDFLRQLVDSRNDTGKRGRIVFDGSVLSDPLADFLAGLPSGNTGIVRGNSQSATVTNSINLFVQDSYKVSSNLTLEVGLRYEFNGVIHDEQKRLSNFIPQSNGLIQEGSDRLPKLYESDFNNFAPRIGAVWDVTGKQRLVIRGSWGIFFNAPQQSIFISLGPFTNSLNSGAMTNPVGPAPAFAKTLSPPIPFGPGLPIFGSSPVPNPPFDLFAVDPNLRTPYFHNYSLGITYEGPKKVILEATYAGSTGRKLFRLSDINQPTPGDAGTKDARRPFFSQFPQFRAIDQLGSTATSSYHSLRLSARGSYGSKLTFNASWVFSKSTDEASSAFELPQDSRNLHAEHALSSFDQRHRFTFSGVYLLSDSADNLRGGWQISGIFNASSGRPLTPIISFDNSGTGTFSDRPDVAGDPHLRTNEVQLFNRGAFKIPPQGSFGDAGRNSLTGPRLVYFDFRVQKEFRLNERIRLAFRWDFFNIFNHPNFDLPSLIVDDPAFGRVNATDLLHGRRKIEAGVRLSF